MTDVLAYLLNDGFIPILVVAIVVMVAIVARVSQTRSAFVEEEDDPNYHTLRSDYQSGMGGGSMTTWKVPKDPEEYARFFVPRGKK
ncbi:hypothetical protein [Phaeobacter sp. C3_T13_0]|uniref:hypothetical protein n=1 Tax=Phaeobacter cretensis TaxID=3342641 RepID=UPI0039BD3A00